MKKFMFGMFVGNVLTNLCFIAICLSDDELADAFDRTYTHHLKSLKIPFIK